VRGDRGGTDLLLNTLQTEHENGVHRRPVNVVVGGDLVIWETELTNAPNNPKSAPSAAAWIMSLDANGLVRQIRLFHPQTLNLVGEWDRHRATTYARAAHRGPAVASSETQR
jgi:hypothetical protein